MIQLNFNKYEINLGKKLILVLQFCLCSIIVAAQANTNLARKLLFDYDWKFDLGDAAVFSSKNFNDENWRKLDLPHDWSIEGEINPKNPTGGAGGYFPAGI